MAAMSRGVAAILVAVLLACDDPNPGSPGIGPPAGSVSPTPAPTPTPTPTPTTPPTPAPSPDASPTPEATPPPTCGDLSMKIIRPDNGATINDTAYTVEAAVGHSVVRVDFYYHIDAFGIAGASSKTVKAPPVLINTRTNPPWRTNWKLPDGCNLTVSLLAIGFDACGGAKDSPLVTVTTCKP